MKIILKQLFIICLSIIPFSHVFSKTNYLADSTKSCFTNEIIDKLHSDSLDTLNQFINCPIPPAPSITTDRTILCNANERATLIASGCNNGTIQWNNGSTSTIIQVSISGTYSAFCMNSCGTSTESNKIIIYRNSLPAPPIISSNKTLICFTETAVLTATGCNGLIKWNTGNIGSMITVNTGGTYSTTCSNFCGESLNSNKVIIKKGETPTTPIAALSAPILCGETSKTLVASGCSGQISWNNMQVGTSITITTSGTYSAVCETVCGVSYQSNIINVQFLVNPIANATNTGPYKFREKIQLTANGGNNYLWRGPNDFISTNSIVSILNAGLDDAGVYEVTITNTFGCSAIATTHVTVNSCSDMFRYSYVRAGDNFAHFFPINNGEVISAIPINTGIIITPICQLDTFNTQSVRIQMTGPEAIYNRNVVENIYPYSPFSNNGFNIYGPIFPVGEYSLTITGYSQDNAQGNIMYGPETIQFKIVDNSCSILMSQNNVSEICAGSNTSINFESMGTFLVDNTFEVQLSDANGSFEIPVKIGESISNETINCQIPLNMPSGNGYKIRVFSTKPAQISNSSIMDFRIHPRNVELKSPNNDISELTNIKAGEKITATNKINIGGNTVYQASRSIILNSGFTTSIGSIFKTEIGGCN
jgi:hypothetical protein